MSHAEPPFDGKPCPCCPGAIRNLFAVAANVSYGADPDGLSRMAELRRAVDAVRPLIDAHFASRAHSHGDGTAQPTAKVIPFTGITKLDLDPDRVLEAQKGRLAGFVLAAYDLEGNELFASTYGDAGTVLWLLKRCERRLLGDAA